MGEPTRVVSENNSPFTVPTKGFVEAQNLKSESPLGQLEAIEHYEIASFGGDRLRHNVAETAHQLPKIDQRLLDDFGDSLASINLSYRDRGLISISALVVMNDGKEFLKDCVEAALKHDVQAEEILDLFQHAQSFVGSPCAIKALEATQDIISRFQKTNGLSDYTETAIHLYDHDTLIRDSRASENSGAVPIILIHALALDSRMFRDVLPALASTTGARVIAYDLRGHGRARGAPLTSSLQHLVADLKLILDILAIPKADVYGASYGGSVAQYFALDYPECVRSLGLIATFGKAPPVFASRATRAEEHGVLSLLSETVIRWFHPETIAANPWCVRYARACIERARVPEWAAAWRVMSQLDTIPRLHELTVPVLSLSGTHDVSATPDYMRAIVESCVNAEADFVPVDNGTHMMVMEQPDDVIQALVSFRTKVDQGQ